MEINPNAATLTNPTQLSGLLEELRGVVGLLEQFEESGFDDLQLTPDELFVVVSEAAVALDRLKRQMSR